jgi:hypothetical protein
MTMSDKKEVTLMDGWEDYPREKGKAYILKNSGRYPLSI